MFLHFGVGRTTMADISREVGIPRQTMYEFVTTRDELVEAVLIRWIGEIAEQSKPRKVDSFGDAFVATSLAAIRTARSDKELMNLVTTGSKDLVQKVIVGRCKEVHDVVRLMYEPILDAGAKSGQLRQDKDRDEIIDWCRIVFLSVITQVDIIPDWEESIIRDFLLTSLCFASPEKKRRRK